MHRRKDLQDDWGGNQNEGLTGYRDGEIRWG